MNPINVKRITPWRLLVQWGFLAWCLFLGVQFALFVRHYTSGGATPAYLRPPGVEGFLPIGAMVSLKHWLLTGTFDATHPAALVIFLAILAMSLLAKKSFCAWLCPVGTLSEALWRLGRRLTGRSFRLWPVPDLLLRGLKYLLLLFFVKLIWVDMPLPALRGFLASPYWAVSDVRMLHFFTGLSTTVAVVLALLVLLSLFVPNAWCRYLCPYGALLGVLSWLSPLKIGRDRQLCTACGACAGACPAGLPVDRRIRVRSAECTGCLSCSDACPAPGALAMRLAWWRRPLPKGTFALAALTLFAAGIAAGMLSGHWQTGLSDLQLQQLIPLAERFGH